MGYNPFDFLGTDKRQGVSAKATDIASDIVNENKLKEIIRGMVREAIKGHKSDDIPYVGKYDKDGDEVEESKKGLWHNIHAKRKRGEKPAKPGDDDYPETLDIDDDYPRYDKDGNRIDENHYDVFSESCGYTIELQPIEEAEYQGRKVKLNKPMQGDVKKFKVYVNNEKGNVVKVNFGAKGMNIKKNNPERRKSFRARHNCDNPGPRHKARYWSCRKW